MKKRIMKATTKRNHTDFWTSDKTCFPKRKIYIGLLSKVGFIATMVLLSIAGLHAQSGSWNGNRQMSNNNHVTDGSGGYVDYGNGVIQLTNDVFSGCTASAVHSGERYNLIDSSFSKCYKVLFGCGDADGMAFSFSYGCNQTDNSWQVWGCGGGLGYRNGCAWNQGITIEFDTYNNTGGDGFDAGYAGSGNDDEIAIHRNLEATDAGKLTAVSVPDLEDGLEHEVCINYDNVSHVVSVTIDGTNRITYDLDNAGLDPPSYFSGDELMTTWSAGTNAGLNFQVVSDGASIYDNTPKTGGVSDLCPQLLPVEFLHVKAQAAPSSVFVTWSTATEESNEKFMIERSNDLSEWEVIGEVSGADHSTSVIQYSFSDYEPLSGTCYYRIKQVDFDGAYAYSNVVAVNSYVHQISIGPNPFEDALTISSDVSGDLDIKIHDVVGRLWYHTRLENENGTLSIQPELSPGTYVISIQTETFIEQRKVIKK